METKEVVKRTMVLKLKGLTELLDQRGQEVRLIINKNYIIHINQVVDQNLPLPKNKQGRVCQGSLKSHVQKQSRKSVKLSPRSLFKTIE